MAFALQGLFGERSLTKLAGVFGDRDAAERMAARLGGEAGLQPAQLRILGPMDAARSRRELFARSVEPETSGIFRTIVRAHVVTGAFGAVLGVLLFVLLFASGVAMVRASPWLSFLAVVGFATTFALMFGGLLALRPDHALLIDELRQALKQGRWALVVHATDARQVDAARQALAAAGAEVLATL